MVHSSSIIGSFNLGFTGPAELDPLDNTNTIQTSVIQLLNTLGTQSPPFYNVPSN